MAEYLDFLLTFALSMFMNMHVHVIYVNGMCLAECHLC